MNVILICYSTDIPKYLYLVMLSKGTKLSLCSQSIYKTQITNSKQQGPPWEDNEFFDCQEIPAFIGHGKLSIVLAGHVSRLYSRVVV